MEKKEFASLGQYLEEYFIRVFSPEYYVHYHQRASEKNFAEWLGLNNQNYSQYKLGTRRPSVEQADSMAKKLGLTVYDLLGMSRRMPKDPWLHFVADSMPDLTDDDKNEIAELIKNKLAKRETLSPKRKSDIV